MIAVVDVGIGNVRSAEKALATLGRPVERTADPARALAATHLVVPGVGAFGEFLAALRDRGLDAVVRARAAADLPTLGVCVGMQALYELGEEHGRHAGLGLLRGRVARLAAGDLPVPHCGWSQARALRDDPVLGPASGTGAAPDGAAWYYFVHSFAATDDDPATRAAETDYGATFPSACRAGALWGVQFHPEKSQQAGLALLARFAALPSPLPAALLAGVPRPRLSAPEPAQEALP